MRYFFLSLFVLLLSFLGVGRPISTLFLYVSAPVQTSVHSCAVTLADYLDFLAKLGSLREENLLLKEEVLNLELRLSDMAVLKQELTDLQEQLPYVDFYESLPFEGFHQVFASVLGNAVDPTHSTVFVSAGTSKGVADGDIVLFARHLVGRVVHAYPQRSLVALIYSPNMRVAVKNSYFDATEGEIIGDRGAGLILRNVLQKEPLTVGDIFVTSGRDGVFPRGLFVGHVTHIYAEPTEPLKSARVVPLIDLERLHHVFVLVHN